MTAEKFKDAIVDQNYSDDKIEKMLSDVKIENDKEKREIADLLNSRRPKVLPNLWVKSFQSFIPR